jgi:hypothetical protein
VVGMRSTLKSKNLYPVTKEVIVNNCSSVKLFGPFIRTNDPAKTVQGYVGFSSNDLGRHCQEELNFAIDAQILIRTK